MRIGLVIADFEMSFTTTFKHTSAVKYNVKFTNSNTVDIIEKLNQLHHNLRSGEANKVHVGYDITVQDVEHVQSLINAILTSYKELFTTTPPRKIYNLINQLREAEKQTPRQIAKEVLKEILNPATTPKLTAKQQLEADTETLSKKRKLKLIQKHSAKKGK